MLDTVRNTPVNGLDMAVLAEAVEAIKKDVSKAKVGFDVTTRWAGQCRSETAVTGFTLDGERLARSHTIVIDEPRELLGNDDAPNPQEMLMAALNACMMFGYVAAASIRGINLESIEIHTKGGLDLRGFLGLSDAVPPGYDSLEYQVHLKGDGSREELEEIHRTVMRTSPNYFNLNRPIRMNGSLQIL
jgi:uncharacterized OsmC-like protein